MRTITIYSADIDRWNDEIERELNGKTREISEERLAQARRFYRLDDTRRCVGAELLRNRALQLATGYDPGRLRIVRDDNGKPFAADLPEVHFNLSHSGRILLCGVDCRPVGVDVEKIRPIDADVAASCFTPPERERLRGKEGEEWQKEFYRLWTLKESYLKMLGTGLRRDPLSVEICPLDSDARCWSGEEGIMQVLPAPEGYAAAACGTGEFTVKMVAL